ncbi:hypothetical protein ACIREO_11615 [Streptomyces sp. NPDC102441]|uniref:hypothetical protein n=1 Tax=Streptomyces sp. NPDC102441 TaxID=3366176 RepID=UPI00382308D2
MTKPPTRAAAVREMWLPVTIARHQTPDESGVDALPGGRQPSAKPTPEARGPVGNNSGGQTNFWFTAAVGKANAANGPKTTMAPAPELSAAPQDLVFGVCLFNALIRTDTFRRRPRPCPRVGLVPLQPVPQCLSGADAELAGYRQRGGLLVRAVVARLR